MIQRDFNNVFALPHPLYTPPEGGEATGREKGEEAGERNEEQLVDVLITPTSLSPSPRLKDVLAQRSPLDSYVNDVLTVPASLAGIPAMSVPVKMRMGGEEEKGEEKVGIQLLAQFGDEEALFEVAEALEGI